MARTVSPPAPTADDLIPAPPPPKRVNAGHHLLSGGLSGLTSAVCLQPLDLLKTRLQQGYDVGRKRWVGRGITDRSHRLGAVARQVVADDGVLGLWRGTVPTVARCVSS